MKDSSKTALTNVPTSNIATTSDLLHDADDWGSDSDEKYGQMDEGEDFETNAEKTIDANLIKKLEQVSVLENGTSDHLPHKNKPSERYISSSSSNSSCCISPAYVPAEGAIGGDLNANLAPIPDSSGN